MRFFNWLKRLRDATFEGPARLSLPAGAATPTTIMPESTLPLNRLALSLGAALLALTLTAGCASKRQDELTKAVVSGEKQVAMEGKGSFFGGRVLAEVTVSRGIGHGFGETGKHGGPGVPSYQDERQAQRDYENGEGKAALGSRLPPVTLHLILTNPGSEPLTIGIEDYESDLGNFVIEPDTLTIPPGLTGEPTAMVSQLGVTSDEIDFKVTLVLAKSSETHTIAVTSLLKADGTPKSDGP